MSFILGIISLLASAAGVYGLFAGYPALIIIGGAAAAISSAYDVFFGQQDNFVTEIIFIVIGLVLGRWTRLEWFYNACLGLCINAIIFSIIAIPYQISMFRMIFKK